MVFFILTVEFVVVGSSGSSGLFLGGFWGWWVVLPVLL
jgi:hypothetical protein